MMEENSTLFLKKMYSYQPPIITVGQPIIIVPPCDVESPILAPGFPPINTVEEPIAILSGGPAHTHMSPTHAAGKPPIKTVGAPGGNIGPPTCGTGPGFDNGQTCISPTLAAKGIY